MEICGVLKRVSRGAGESYLRLWFSSLCGLLLHIDELGLVLSLVAMESFVWQQNSSIQYLSHNHLTLIYSDQIEIGESMRNAVRL